MSKKMLNPEYHDKIKKYKKEEKWLTIIWVSITVFLFVLIGLVSYFRNNNLVNKESNLEQQTLEQQKKEKIKVDPVVVTGTINNIDLKVISDLNNNTFEVLKYDLIKKEYTQLYSSSFKLDDNLNNKTSYLLTVSKNNYYSLKPPFLLKNSDWEFDKYFDVSDNWSPTKNIIIWKNENEIKKLYLWDANWELKTYLENDFKDLQRIIIN